MIRLGEIQIVMTFYIAITFSGLMPKVFITPALKLQCIFIFLGTIVSLWGFIPFQ